MAFGPTLAYDAFWKADFQNVQFFLQARRAQKTRPATVLVLVKHTEVSSWH